MKQKGLLILIILLFASIIPVKALWFDGSLNYIGEVGGGPVTFAQNFTATSMTLGIANQVRVNSFRFDPGGALWTTIGFRCPANATSYVTQVLDGTVKIDHTVVGNTTFELYVGLKGSPGSVTNTVGWAFANQTVTYNLSAPALVTFAWAAIATYNITLGALYDELDVGFTTLLYANVTGPGGSPGNLVTFRVDGEPFKWNPAMNRYEAKVVHNTPQTIVYDDLTHFVHTGDPAANGTLMNTVTVTWTTGLLERLRTSNEEGDWIGGILGEYTNSYGAMLLYSLLMLIVSIGIYNVAGVYATLLVWIFGWGIFSAAVHGGSLWVAYVFIVLGLAAMVVKLILDRRTT